MSRATCHLLLVDVLVGVLRIVGLEKIDELLPRVVDESLTEVRS